MSKVNPKYHLSIMTSFIWLGFVSAISFMESWLKFNAEGVTLPIGLNIGKLVFSWLNRVEWIFALLIFFNFFITSQNLKLLKALFMTILGCLAIQSIWLLPLLDKRADLIISGREIKPSFDHFYYVGFELIKALSLLLLGINFLKYRAVRINENIPTGEAVAQDIRT